MGFFVCVMISRFKYENILARGGIEIIAVFIGISGGLWSEKQIELKRTLKAEKTALKSIRDEFYRIQQAYIGLFLI